VTRAQVQLKNEKQRLLVAQNEDGRAKLNLIRAIGFSFDVQLILTDELKLIPVPVQTTQDALQVAQENRVELRAQARRERLTAMTLSSVTSERIPSLTGGADVGVIGNKISDALTTNNVQVLLSIPIFDGGPVQRERGFVIHRSGQEWDAMLPVSDDITVTTSRDILAAVARGEGPGQALIALGYAGWGAGQLEREMAENAWLNGPADQRILFDLPHEQRWEAAAALLGVDFDRLSDQTGHA